MRDRGIHRIGVVRLLVVVVLLAGIVGLSLETRMTAGKVVAAKGKAHGPSGEGPKKEKKPKPEKADKPEKPEKPEPPEKLKGSEKAEKEKKPKKDHGHDAEQVELESHAVTTAAPAKVAIEFPTAAAALTGAIEIQGFSCPFEAVHDDALPPDWFDDCTQPVLKATFELTALDGNNAGWQWSETVDEGGVLRVSDLSPGRYRLVQIDADWCHAESDRVDDGGNVVVTAGERASVWIFNCLETTIDSPSMAK